MNSKVTIKNFRVFDEVGATIDFKPITILTGGNNSGKSSIVKALLLLKDFCHKIKIDYEDGKKVYLENYVMDFHKSPNSILGSFDHVIHHGNNSGTDCIPKGNVFSVDLVVASSWLLQDVKLHLEFGPDNHDELNNGYLIRYSITTLDGKLIYKAERGGTGSMDFTIVKKQFLHFLYGQYALAEWQNEWSSLGINTCDIDDYSFEASTISKWTDFNNAIINTKTNIGAESLLRLFEWQITHGYEETGGKNNNLIYLYSSAADSLLKKEVADSSFITQSPNLNVFCYYPCLEKLKSIDKKEIRSYIKSLIETYDEQVHSLIMNSVDRFLDSFEASNAKTIDEYISNEEDKFFFKCNDLSEFQIHGWDSNEFAIPKHGNRLTTQDWRDLLRSMDLINRILMKSDHSYWINNEWGDFYFLEPDIYYFLRRIIAEVFAQVLPGTLSYASTTIIQPQRLYNLDGNDDFINTLKDYIELSRKSSYNKSVFIDKWLQQLDIAHHFAIITHAEGYGASIQLYSSENDSLGIPLVDKGLGVLHLFAILLKIQIAILKSKESDYRNCVKGFKDFVSFEGIEPRTYNVLNPITISLEEPEVHLHPKYQSLLAEMLLEAYNNYGIHFIVETHSEYLIRKTQVFVAQQKYDSEESMNSNNPFKVYYVPNDGKPYEMNYRTDGKFSNEFGTGFFDEASNLLFDIL